MLSQLLTLFTTPVIYLVFDRIGARIGRRQYPDGNGTGPAEVQA